jgi:hypothetical protein
MKELLNVMLWLAGIGHFVVLIASFQVPCRLHWVEELPRLSSFNRKLMWVHGAFAILTITAFALLTLLLHKDMLLGVRAALGVAAFIATYWTARAAVDFLYYEHADWPKGRQFAVGHALLTGLFCAMAATYWLLILWHWLIATGGKS